MNNRTCPSHLWFDALVKQCKGKPPIDFGVWRIHIIFANNSLRPMLMCIALISYIELYVSTISTNQQHTLNIVFVMIYTDMYTIMSTK